MTSGGPETIVELKFNWKRSQPSQATSRKGLSGTGAERAFSQRPSWLKLMHAKGQQGQVPLGKNMNSEVSTYSHLF